jgi:hypothetical protein
MHVEGRGGEGRGKERDRVEHELVLALLDQND